MSCPLIPFFTHCWFHARWGTSVLKCSCYILANYRKKCTIHTFPPILDSLSFRFLNLEIMFCISPSCLYRQYKATHKKNTARLWLYSKFQVMSLLFLSPFIITWLVEVFSKLCRKVHANDVVGTLESTVIKFNSTLLHW